MKLTEMQKGMIERLIRGTFYYVGFPDPIQSGFWRDGNGKLNSINSMGLEPLQGAIKKIEFDLKHYTPPTTDTKQQKVCEKIVIEPAKEKLRELKAVYSEKI